MRWRCSMAAATCSVPRRFRLRYRPRLLRGSGGSHCEGAGLLFPISSETDTGKSEKHHRPSRWLRYCADMLGYREGREIGRNVIIHRSIVEIVIPQMIGIGAINCMRKRGRDRCGQRSIIVVDTVVELLELPGTGVLGCVKLLAN